MGKTGKRLFMVIATLALLAPAIVSSGGPAGAATDNVLHVMTVNVDPPTLLTLGVQMLITGDDNANAQVTARYRATGTSTWRPALPLFRVHPENSPRPIPAQFAGSIFDLAPGTAYDIELHATDPDGPVDQTVDVSATTRTVPAADPQHPSTVHVGTAAQLHDALDAAQPGTVIDVANGFYDGQFVLDNGGTAADPIVVRGASENGVVLDAGGCSACNVFEVYGSHVHIEALTLQHANRGLRFEGMNTTDNVVRRTHIRDVRLGIGSNDDQSNFYLCDNVVEGRLRWPLVYGSDRGRHSDDDGINISGNGHVVCHNAITGFGDAMKYGQDGARADDFYGNDVDGSYDNGIEFDGSEGNVRAFRNRFTNTWDTISFQPVNGGPDYAIRNVVVNGADEALKFHANDGNPPQDPNGVLVYQNTFVDPTHTLNMETSDPSYHFVIENNLFVGPASPPGHVVDWSAPIIDGQFDHDGWYPDGFFDFNAVGKWPSFAAMQAAGAFETNGRVLSTPIFASGLAAPDTYKALVGGADATLAATSNALDAAAPLANVSDAYNGPAPDLGALERGCPLPIFGVRPVGIDDTNEPTGCGGPTVAPAPAVVPIGTTALTLKDRTGPPASPAARKISFKALTKSDGAFNRVVMPARNRAGDPTIVGATLTVYNSDGSAEKVVVPLPAARWKFSSKGYQYTGGSGAAISKVFLGTDEIDVGGGGSQWGYALSAPTQGRIALELAFSNAVAWCTDAPAKAAGKSGSTASSDHVDLFVAAPKSPAPATCAAIP